MQPLLKFSFGNSSGWPFASAASFVERHRLAIRQRADGRVFRAADFRQVLPQFVVERPRLAHRASRVPAPPRRAPSRSSRRRVASRPSGPSRSTESRARRRTPASASASTGCAPTSPTSHDAAIARRDSVDRGAAIGPAGAGDRRQSAMNARRMRPPLPPLTVAPLSAGAARYPYPQSMRTSSPRRTRTGCSACRPAPTERPSIDG